MGTGLGRVWAKHGHHVMFSYSRRPEKLENLVLEIGSHARSGTPRDAVGFANVLFEDWMKQFRSASSNFECDIDELIDDGMRVAVRWTWSGTHTGHLLGIAPTNRKIEFSETHLLRISGDRIAEDHVSANLLDLLDQLGTTQFAAA
jgi:predicted ester cyclase